MKSFRRFALLLVPVLAGCTAEVATSVDVHSPTSATLTSTVTFDGEAATVIADDEALFDELVVTFENRAGVAPQVTRDDGQLIVSAQVDDQQLAAAGPVSGVGGVALVAGGDGLVTATVSVVEPTDLIAALRAAGDDQPDGDAVADALLAGTSMRVTVRFAGGVRSAVWADSSGAETLAAFDDTVSFTRPLLDVEDGTLTVSGDTTTPDGSLFDRVKGAGMWAVAAVAVIAVAVQLRRSRAR